MDDVTVRPLTAALREDFFRVHCESEGCGWCYCVAWHVPTWDGWRERTDAENRALREGLFARGEHDGYLLHVGGEPAGWCQAGPRDRLLKLVATYGLAPDPDVWAITCFALRPGFRGRGLAHRLLAGAVDDLARRGVTHVQGFPARGDAPVWTGTASLFRGAGFAVEGEAKRGPVYGRRL